MITIKTDKLEVTLDEQKIMELSQESKQAPYSDYDVTPTGLAEILGLGKQTIYSKKNAGQLKFRQEGGRYIINTLDIMRDIHKISFHNKKEIVRRLQDFNRSRA